ncbi:MAG: acyltransferase [Pirellulales bacterium]
MTSAITNTVIVEPAKRSSAFRFLKRGVQFLFYLLVLPRLITYWSARALLGARAFSAASESIARLPGLRGVYLRQAFYRATLSRCGQDIYIGWNSAFSMTEATLGDQVYIGRHCSIGFAEIGDQAMLGDGVQILSGGHEHGEATSPETTRQSAAQCFQQVRIGRGAWIGAGALVMADVGDHAVIGAGAVVTRPIPARATAVGVPARCLRASNQESI